MKKKTIFECQSCGFQSLNWLGKCTSCHTWDSLIELSQEQLDFIKNKNNYKNLIVNQKALSIINIKQETLHKTVSGSKELDLVLGGGIVSGSMILIGGSPGIGKSTLLLKIAGNLAKNKNQVLYVSGEESTSQIKLRADRLSVFEKNLFLLSEINLDIIKNEINASSYNFIIIDSIQTLYSPDTQSASGSVTQVRNITFQLMRIAKNLNISIFIIGHITKDGSIAGPRILEHIVDVVLYFEGDRNSELRLLRGFKNRFGSTNEVGIFEMKKDGLLDAKNMGEIFLKKKNPISGSSLTVIMEGSRPIIIEIQALVTEAYGNPKRSSTGFDNNRLVMLLALLEKKINLPLNTYDVFINISGGIKINDPSADLAVIAAILSSYRNRVLSSKTIFLGEISLTGEIREVKALPQRLKEIKMQGFERVIIPNKPLEDCSIKYFIATEVSKIIDWL